MKKDTRREREYAVCKIYLPYLNDSRLFCVHLQAKQTIWTIWEDEYYSIIEKRDTEILQRDKLLAQQNVQLAQKSAQLEEQSAQIKEQSAQIEEQNNALRNSVQMLLKTGLSIDAVADCLGLDLQTVKSLGRIE